MNSIARERGAVPTNAEPTQDPPNIAEPKGKLGVLLPGMGAVATTFIAGVESVRQGMAQPIGSLTQMGTIRLGKRSDKRTPAIRDFIPLATLDDLVFGGWDIRADNCYEIASHGGVLEQRDLDRVRGFMEGIAPMPAVFDQEYVKRLSGTHVKKAASKWDLAQMVLEDIEQFQTRNQVARTVMVWCGSTETFLKPGAVHQSIESFEKGLRENDPGIAPSMVLRLRGAEGRHPLRQRRSEPVGGHPGADGTG